MKKGILCLLAAALIFSSGLIGFHLGRRSSPSPIIVEKNPKATVAAAPTQTQTVGRVNINTATLEELQTLPGIGPVLAQRIIDFREENGDFETVSQLTMVSGIGISKLEELLDYITVGGES